MNEKDFGKGVVRRNPPITITSNSGDVLVTSHTYTAEQYLDLQKQITQRIADLQSQIDDLKQQKKNVDTNVPNSQEKNQLTLNNKLNANLKQRTSLPTN